MSEVRCHKCGRSPASGFVLKRVNEKGTPGIWECWPGPCGVVLYQPDALVQVLKEAVT